MPLSGYAGSARIIQGRHGLSGLGHIRACESTSFPGEHDLISLGVDAHRKMRLFPWRIAGRLATQLAACGDDFPGALYDIGDLETHPRPGPPARPSTMNPDRGSRHLDFADEVRSAGYGCIQRITVKGKRPADVSSPDNILGSFDLHCGMLTAERRKDNCKEWAVAAP